MLKHLLESRERKKYTVKLSVEEHAKIQAKADEFTGGNLAEWLRYAGARHRPPKTALTKDSRK